MDAKTAQSVFGGFAQSKKRTSKEEPPVNLKSANDSLVKKNLQLKQQLGQYLKTIENLRNENVALRKKNQELIDGTLEQKIELIVEQRVKNRLGHAAVLHQKLVRTIQQTGLELSGIFKEFEPEANGFVNRRQPKIDVTLERLDESPVRNSELNEENEDFTVLQPKNISSAENLATGTPRKKHSGVKGRRSELFQSSFTENVEPTEEEAPSTSTASRRGPMIIAPSATPVGLSKQVPRKAPTPRFKKPSTPAPVQPKEDVDISSTVRRQRSAKINIKSFKEPSSRDKLRRPGKHDEPMPFINTFF